MAVSLGNADRDDHGEIAEINVTPFIDVILVLLIIFMVAAPISTVDVPVDLPASAAPATPRPDKPVFVTIKADGGLAVGEREISWAGLASEIGIATSLKKDARLFLRADKSVPYGEIMRLFDALRAEGYLKLALVALERGSSPSPQGTKP
jgi:biopolymer transport protein ExbD